MNKRLIALAGGAAALAASVVPVGSAFGFITSTTPTCIQLGRSIELTSQQLDRVEMTTTLTPRQQQQLISALNARLEQLDVALEAAHCVYTGP